MAQDKPQDTTEFEALRDMPRKQLDKALRKCVEGGDIGRIRDMLKHIVLSEEKKKGLFGDPPPAGTLHPDQLADIMADSCYHGSPAVVQCLLDSTDGLLERTGNRALRNAAYSANELVVDMLIKKGVDPALVMRNSDLVSVNNTLRPYVREQMLARQRAELTQLEEHDGTAPPKDWTVMGEHCVAWSQAADNGAALTNIFNFRSKEVATTVTSPGVGVPSAPTLRGFDDFSDKAMLREAEGILKKTNGGPDRGPDKFKV